VGNDVVDLDDADNRRTFARPGAVERVCTEAERRAVREAAEPEVFFWSVFAAKEASYKLLVKLGEEPGLAHRRIEVLPDLRSVRYRDRELGLSVERATGWVHALATLGPAAPAHLVEEASPHARPGAAGRALLCRMVAELLRVPSEALSVERLPSATSYDGFEPPRLFLAGEPTELDVSLSHDGRFVAAALVGSDTEEVGAPMIRAESASRAGEGRTRGGAGRRE
jgi:phosphopantetheinyl transferase (holo-ACP synthase)